MAVRVGNNVPAGGRRKPAVRPGAMILAAYTQIRSAIGLLNPDHVRRTCAEPPQIGLVASTPAGYAAMEDFLIPAAVMHERRLELMQYLHRAGDPDTPANVELVLFEAGMPCPRRCVTWYPDDPARTMDEVLADRPDLGIALARFFLPFRKPVVDSIVQSVSRENALFALATALPNVIPNVFQLPWAVSEFASDTMFITLNQVRMALSIAAASGKDIGFSEQSKEILPVLTAALGWRAIARELAGKIPLGAGVVAKGAVAYAGTFVIGKGLERVNNGRRPLTRLERRQAWDEGLERGRAIASGGSAESGS